MEQFNRVLTFIFILLFAFGVAFFIFYRLGLFQRIFPQAKLSLPAFFSGTTTTPTPTPTLSPDADVVFGQETTTTPDLNPTIQQLVPLGYPAITTPHTKQIPGTGSPTVLLPILGSLFGAGLYLHKKS